MKPDISASIGPLRMERPAMLASGILGISLAVFGRVMRAGAGAVVTKSISAGPREGYPNPTVVGAGGGGWLNAVGLSNPGAAAFAGEVRGNSDVPMVVSLVGSGEAEFAEMIGELEGCRVDAYELNLSCPHVERVGLEVGDDPGLVGRIVAAAKGASRAPVIAKVGLGSSDYIRTAEAAAEAGADAITAINTVRAMSIDVEARRPSLSNGIGGLSGPPVRPVAVRCVHELTSRLEVPVVGCGGVSSWRDAAEFLLAGACAVQVGTAVAARGPAVFAEINEGLEGYLGRCGMSRLSELVGLAKGS